MKVLVTGASGFIGNALAQKLNSSGYLVTGATRSCSKESSNFPCFSLGDFNSRTDWSLLLQEVDCVIHCAAYSSVTNKPHDELLSSLNDINVNASTHLAKQAAELGVKRFVFISSIKVNGEQTFSGSPFTEDNIPFPQDAYAMSKLEAEQKLFKIAAETGLEVVIVRPPLVYGPGVKGNFKSMIRVVKNGIPVPLGAIFNKRSLVSIDNLVDFVITCIEHPDAANQIFLVGDGNDLSTTDLLRCLAEAAGVSSRLIPVPASILMFVARLLGKKAVAHRLLGSLQVDISKARHRLGWTPPFSIEEGFSRCFNSTTEKSTNL